VLVPPPHVIVPPSEGPALALPQPNTDRLRIEQLQQRVDQLERRLERLEHEQSAKGR
jgi:TolA-binding protein